MSDPNRKSGANYSSWDMEADVVVAGAGAAGLAASLEAVLCEVSVLLIEENVDVGGHAILSGGNFPIGGGTSLQKKYGISDSADLVYRDWTDPSVPESRYNDRELIRVWADNNASTFEWLVENGVRFRDERPKIFSFGTTVARSCTSISDNMPSKENPAGRAGAGIIRPLEAAARKKGVRIILRCKLKDIIREDSRGKVLGITATNLVENKIVRIGCKRGVVITTGGGSSNVNFRRIFDPRLTEEYQVAGEPYSFQSADGELAAMAVGAALYATANQTNEYGRSITKPGQIGCRYGYDHLKWLPKSPYFSLAGASGLTVSDWQDVILVNQVGNRFHDETKGNYEDPPTTFGWIDAALGPNGGDSNGGGPIWAIFDSEAVKREGWNVQPPDVDYHGWFFKSDSIAGLARSIVNMYQKSPISAEALTETVRKYNGFVDAGRDKDFGKPSPRFKVEIPPFYAAWATPVVHDTRTGLRINAKCEVIDTSGNIISGLYCAGESAGGFGMHGLPRCIVQGRIAGRNAAKELALPPMFKDTKT
ncbi:MAG: FAD-binding protein [Nitrososphaerota archaeon]|nr:FAD-binding protein [Nitrososphaerota archaeon]